MISACAEARRNRSKSTNIFILPHETYTPGKMLITSSTGEFASRNLRNSISCGKPDISDIFTILSCSSVRSVGQSFSQKSKSGASNAADVFDEPYEIIRDARKHMMKKKKWENKKYSSIKQVQVIT